MYALRVLLGLVFVTAQTGVLAWTALSGSARAADTPVSAEAGKHVQVITQQHALEPGAALNVRTANGGITVIPWDEPGLRLVAEKTMQISKTGAWLFGGPPFKNDAEAQAYFDKIEFIIEGNEKALAIRALLPDSRRGVSRGISFTLSVPRAVELDLDTSNGAIRVTGTEGEVLADTSNGGITVAEIAGDTMLKSSNGPINGTKIFGRVEAKTSNGGITLKQIEGPVKADTSNGPITCEAVAGALEADTSNGGILVSVPTELSQSVSCETSNGPIQLKLSKNSAFKLDAKTNNGGIRSDFSLPSPPRGKQLENVNAEINGGGPRVSLRTTNAFIKIEGV